MSKNIITVQKSGAFKIYSQILKHFDVEFLKISITDNKMILEQVYKKEDKVIHIQKSGVFKIPSQLLKLCNVKFLKISTQNNKVLLEQVSEEENIEVT